MRADHFKIDKTSGIGLGSEFIFIIHCIAPYGCFCGSVGGRGGKILPASPSIIEAAILVSQPNSCDHFS